MKCGFCGNDFDEKNAERTCASCPFKKGCRLIKCPKCGYEMPPEPGWAKFFSQEDKKNENK